MPGDRLGPGLIDRHATGQQAAQRGDVEEQNVQPFGRQKNAGAGVLHVKPYASRIADQKRKEART